MIFDEKNYGLVLLKYPYDRSYSDLFGIVQDTGRLFLPCAFQPVRWLSLKSQLVFGVHQLRLSHHLIIILIGITLHQLPIYLDGLSKRLKLPTLILVTSQQVNGLTVTMSSWPMLFWWLGLLIRIIFNCMLIPMGNLNGSNLCNMRLILYRKIRLGN